MNKIKNQNIKRLITISLIVAIICTFYSYINNNVSYYNSTIHLDIEQAVANAIKTKGQESYSLGELATEGHKILEFEEKDNVVKVYTLSSFSYFGFENGVFTVISGNGAIPTIITFSKNINGEYSLIDYNEPMEGDQNFTSTLKMFPIRLWEGVLTEDSAIYSNLFDQQETQAKNYLEKIGRTAQVSSHPLEMKLPEINVSAENKLFCYLGSEDLFLNNCPYWLGTKEIVQDGVRLIFETSQTKSSDGYDLITFKETKADGTVVEKHSYKIVGSEPELQP